MPDSVYNGVIILIRACGMGSFVTTENPERRHHSRTKLSEVVHIRPIDSRLPPDSCKTFNVSSEGLYLATSADQYIPGANVYVTSDFQSSDRIDYATEGVVVRVEKLEDNKWGVAIHLSPTSL